jgi:hypothetical protein
MTQRETAPPTINAQGDEEHPAFGQIHAHRVSSTPGVTLFDSDIKHGNSVRITINRAVRKRELSQDWIFGRDELIEVELSEAQWAGFVSSMNTSGVPCTIRRTETDWNIPELEYDPRLAHSMGEVKGAAVKTFGKIREALADYEKAVAEKAGAKIIKEKLRVLHFAVENSGANMHFAAKVLVEHTENVVQKARADIEAMVTQKAVQLGLTAGQAEGLLELPAMPGEVSAQYSEFDVPPVAGCCLDIDNRLVHDPEGCATARAQAGQVAQ